MMLTKEQLLKGLEYREEYEVQRLGGFVLLRPLSSFEAAKIREVTLQGIALDNLEGIGEDEVKKKIFQTLGGGAFASLLKNSSEATWLICSYGIVDEEGKPLLSIDEVKQLPPGVPEEIAEKIKDISGMEEEEVLPFRE